MWRPRAGPNTRGCPDGQTESGATAGISDGSRTRASDLVRSLCTARRTVSVRRFLSRSRASGLRSTAVAVAVAEVVAQVVAAPRHRCSSARRRRSLHRTRRRRLPQASSLKALRGAPAPQQRQQWSDMSSAAFQGLPRRHPRPECLHHRTAPAPPPRVHQLRGWCCRCRMSRPSPWCRWWCRRRLPSRRCSVSSVRSSPTAQTSPPP